MTFAACKPPFATPHLAMRSHRTHTASVTSSSCGDFHSQGGRHRSVASLLKFDHAAPTHIGKVPFGSQRDISILEDSSLTLCAAKAKPYFKSKLRSNYRVIHTVCYMGWVDLDLEFPWLAGRYHTCLPPRQDSGTSQI